MNTSADKKANPPKHAKWYVLGLIGIGVCLIGILLWRVVSGSLLLLPDRKSGRTFIELGASAQTRLSREEGAYPKEKLPFKDLEVRVHQFEQEVARKNEEAFQETLVSDGYILMDDKGNILAGLNPEKAQYPASMTKLMTAIVAVDMTEDLDARITIGELTGCYDNDSVIMFLEEGETISMRDLLYALLMCSYNDAATAIAMEVGGSLEGFADLMNQKAAELGLVNSHFITPHGLHEEGHYSCPYDMALLIKTAMSIPLLKQILETTTYSCDMTSTRGEEYTYLCTSTNLFLNSVYAVPGLTYLGGKTGFDIIDRSNFASCFTNGENTYYITVMKALDAPYMSALIMDYYFAPYSMYAHAKSEPVMKKWQLEYEASYEQDDND